MFVGSDLHSSKPNQNSYLPTSLHFQVEKCYSYHIYKKPSPSISTFNNHVLVYLQLVNISPDLFMFSVHMVFWVVYPFESPYHHFVLSKQVVCSEWIPVNVPFAGINFELCLFSASPSSRTHQLLFPSLPLYRESIELFSEVHSLYLIKPSFPFRSPPCLLQPGFS